MKKDSYFSRRANTYQMESCRPPWSLLRSAESKAIDRAMGDAAQKSILELGCGAGYHSKRYIEMAPRKLVAIDISKEMVNQIKDPRIECIVGDAATIKLPEKFDLILSAGLLEFVKNVEDIFKNAREHALRQGKLVLLLPKPNIMGRIYQLYHKNNNVKVHLHNLEEIKNCASRCGWVFEYKNTVFPLSVVLSFKVENI